MESHPEMAQDDARSVDVSIVVPVNAQGDQDAAMALLGDLARYRGPHRFETIVVLNNYAPDEEPRGQKRLEDSGARVVRVPDVRTDGLSVYIGARSLGARNASADTVVLFDADCRIPDSTALIDWYVDTLRDGTHAAYTAVRHHSLSRHPSVRIRVRLHHAARWFKRVVLRVPTMRGSNYAVPRSTFLRLVDAGRIIHDIDVGPALKAEGVPIRYGGASELRVLTSGRYLRAGWGRVLRWVPKRLAYHLRRLRRS